MAEARTPETVEATGAADKAADAADEATMEDFIQLNKQRAATYGLLSRLYRVEIDEELLEELRGMRFPAKTGSDEVDAGYRLIAQYLSNAWDNSVTDLAVDYVRTFIGHGVDAFSAAYPFESVYTSEKRLLMQEGARRGAGHLPRGGPRQAGQLEGGRGPHRARAGVRADPCEPHGRSA